MRQVTRITTAALLAATLAAPAAAQSCRPWIGGSVRDGGFEAGTPSARWEEGSSTTRQVVCDASCPVGPPSAGSWYAAFGGEVGGPSAEWAIQDLQIPAETELLTFQLRIDDGVGPSGNGQDALNVFIDGMSLFSVLEDDPTYLGGYVLVELDVTAFADGYWHQLTFESSTTGAPGATVFLVDEVALCRMDATPPGAVAGVRGLRNGDDVELSWQRVKWEAGGGPEQVAHYNVYRDPARDFVADRVGGSNRIASPTAEAFTDAGAAADGQSHHYQVSVVDAAGNEGPARTPLSAPVLTGARSPTQVDLSWTPSLPAGPVAGYRLFQGTTAEKYDTVIDLGTATSQVVTGLPNNVGHFFAVAAYQTDGELGPLSNVFQGWLGDQTVQFRAVDQAHLEFPGPNANSGREFKSRVAWPAGDWVLAEMTLTLQSYACIDTGCSYPDGCGDLFDRTAQVYLILDESCLPGTCRGNGQQLELLRVITPFGTDRRVGPRTHTYDLTPFVPLLTGEKVIAVYVDTWDGNGWWADLDFYMTEDPAQASAEPPADGIEPVFFRYGVGAGGWPLANVPVTIPATATSVKARLFTSGHGGADAGGDPACIGPADEFCRRNNQILIDDSPAWVDEVWRTDCSPSLNPCNQYNACGFPSCTFDRAGWCPGLITCHDNEPCDQDLDATWLAPGGTYQIGYDIPEAFAGGSWHVSLVVYWYE